MTDVHPPLRAFSLARQSVKKDDGIAHQRRQNIDLIESRGWVLAFDEADNNVSATKSRGTDTAWWHALAAWDRDEYDVLVVTRVDRLVRNVYSPDLADVVNRKMRVCVGGMTFDLADPYHQAMFSSQAVYATQEVRGKEFRRAPVITAARAAGHPKAGKVPFGYRWVDLSERKHVAKTTGADVTEVRRYEVVEAEAEIVRFIASEVLAHSAPADVNLRSICRSLAERGARTHSGSSFGPTSVKRAVLNPAVAALLAPIKGAGEQDPTTVVADECSPGSWTPILEFERWLAVRGMLLPESRRTNGGTTARKHLLGGLATCGTCGLNMKSGVNRHGNVIYRCRSERHNSRSAEVIDLYIEEVAIRRLSASDARELLRRRDGVDVPELRGRRRDLVRRRDEGIKLVMTGVATADEAAAGLSSLKLQIEEIDGQLRAAHASDPLAPVVDVEDVRAAWRNLDLGAKRAVITTLMTVTVRPLSRGGRVRTWDQARASIGIAWNVPMWPDDDDEEMLSMVILSDGTQVPEMFPEQAQAVAAAVT